MPDAGQRLRLWQQALDLPSFPPAKDVDIPALAERYQISGSSIASAVSRAQLTAVERSSRELRQKDLEEAIQRELLRQD